MRDGGKGDSRRKLVVPEEVFNSNWDSIFGKPKNANAMTKDEMNEYSKELTDSINEKIRNNEFK
jgi:hypothetical protein